MLKAELSLLQEFASNIEFVVPVVQKFLSQSFEGKEVVIDASHLLSHKLVYPIDDASSDCITVQRFVERFVARWREEINYQDEVVLMKDKIIESFNQISAKITDLKLINFVANQRQDVVECFINATEIDKKQKAGDFCKGLMNGFDCDVLSKIDDFAQDVLWMPFLTPFPLKIIEFINKTFEDDVKDINETALQNFSAKIIAFIHQHFQIAVLNINDSCTDCELKVQLEKLLKKRKLCTLVVEYLNSNISFIAEKRLKINCIQIKLRSAAFMANSIPFIYESLELYDFDNGADCQNLFDKIPKGLRELNIYFGKSISGGFETFCKNLTKITSLNKLFLNFSSSQEITKNDTKELVNSIIEIPCLREVVLDLRNIIVNYEIINQLDVLEKKETCKKVFYIENFHDSHFRNLSDQALGLLGRVFKNTKYLENLRLNPTEGFATDEGIEFLASSLKNMNTMTQLYLNLSQAQTKITNEGIDLVSRMLASMPNIVSLTLNFRGGNNQITDNAVSKLSNNLKDLKKMGTLFLSFSGGRNSITDVGFEKMITAFHELKDLVKLELYLYEGYHDISDTSMEIFANVLKKMDSLSRLVLWITNGESNKKVSEYGKNLIRTARKYINCQILQVERYF